MTARQVASVQAAFYVGTGVWPLMHRRSFEWVTGPKTDFWLAQTVGLTVAAIGIGLAQAGIATRRCTAGAPYRCRHECRRARACRPLVCRSRAHLEDLSGRRSGRGRARSRLAPRPGPARTWFARHLGRRHSGSAVLTLLILFVVFVLVMSADRPHGTSEPAPCVRGGTAQGRGGAAWWRRGAGFAVRWHAVRRHLRGDVSGD